MDIEDQHEEIPPSESAGDAKTTQEPPKFPMSVLPGDDVTEFILKVTDSIRVGGGLAERDDSLVVTTAGLLQFKPPNKFWVETAAKRTTVLQGDMVVGVVGMKRGLVYQIDLGSSLPAEMGYLEFDGASKQNHPRLREGDVVYAHVTRVPRHLPVELSCKSLHGKKRDWVTGESVFGVLKGGTTFDVPHLFSRRLRDRDCHVLKCLGTSLPFELAAGMNGRVWISAANAKHAIVAQNAILNSQYLTADETQVMVERLVASLDA